MRYPQMLTHDEQVLWKLVRERKYLWLRNIDGYWQFEESYLIFARLREHWSNFKKVAEGDLPQSILPGSDDDEFPS
jgi:hypothetical protein